MKMSSTSPVQTHMAMLAHPGVEHSPECRLARRIIEDAKMWAARPMYKNIVSHNERSRAILEARSFLSKTNPLFILYCDWGGCEPDCEIREYKIKLNASLEKLRRKGEHDYY